MYKLTYVAITRATHEAFITYSNMSELVGRLVVQVDLVTGINPSRSNRNQNIYTFIFPCHAI